jgi:hypothetical protein
MAQRRTLSLFRTGALLALAATMAACTKGGQFDPTTLLDNDMFDTKKPLAGQREPVFPNGVPGASTGIPADLYKGYQPPPDQAADNGAGAPGAATPIGPPANEPPKAEARAKPKPRPKPKVARAPEQPHTTISIGLNKKPKPAEQQQAQQPQATQTAWPNPNQAAQPAQSPWPAPPQSQTAWPSPQQGAPAQPAQTAWPNPTGAAPAQ